MLDLRELALEYCDLLSRSEDEDDTLDEDEEERLAELSEFSHTIGDGADALYYPNDLSIELVKDDSEVTRAWAMSNIEDQLGGEIPDVLADYIDYDKYAEDWLGSDYCTVEWEGWNYYYR